MVRPCLCDLAGCSPAADPEEFRRQVPILGRLPGFAFLEHDSRRALDRPSRYTIILARPVRGAAQRPLFEFIDLLAALLPFAFFHLLVMEFVFSSLRGRLMICATISFS